jgi:hypothetical protein
MRWSFHRYLGRYVVVALAVLVARLQTAWAVIPHHPVDRRK